MNQLDRFVEQLCELDIDPQRLREDASGASWLPASLYELTQRDEACALELAEFVEMELSLLDVHEPCDAFFTRRVLDSLPQVDAVDETRRTWILASAYALAIGLTYVLVGPMFGSGEIAAYFAPLHDWYHDHALETGGLWMALALMCTAGALVVLPTGGGGRRSFG